MNINRNNYEVYFLDYLEGRLTTDETAALLLFVDENPDLKELLEGDELISLVPDEKISFFPKSALKKNSVSGIENEQGVNAENHNFDESFRTSINEGNYEEFMIRYYENELKEIEKNELANFLKNSPTYIKEFEAFGSTILKPDINVSYPYKSSLKRKLIIQPQAKRIFAIVSVAASLLLFSTLFLKYINQPIPNELNNKLAVKNENRTETVKPVSGKNNIASVNSTEIISKDKSAQTNSAPILNGISTGKPTVTLQGSENGTPNQVIKKTERVVFDVPSSLTTIQSAQLAFTDIKAPKTIERRTDFDGITSAAYYDPEPDATPLKTDGKNIGGRFGYTLANSISQTAGTIAREPELGRLLRGKVSLSDLAKLGIAGFNYITDRKFAGSQKDEEDINQNGQSNAYDSKKVE